jgi:sialic acid synthase SpsE
MDMLRAFFGCPVGFSDHTIGNAVPVAAVARGASVIEKHFVLSRKIDTPDAFFSAEPDQFAEMVNAIRAVESACTPCGMRLEIGEEENRCKQANCYRLVLNRTRQAGERFGPADFLYKRHGHGVDCRQEKLVMEHMAAACVIEAGELLSWDKLKGVE